VATAADHDNPPWLDFESWIWGAEHDAFAALANDEQRADLRLAIPHRVRTHLARQVKSGEVELKINGRRCAQLPPELLGDLWNSGLERMYLARNVVLLRHAPPKRADQEAENISAGQQEAPKPAESSGQESAPQPAAAAPGPSEAQAPDQTKAEAEPEPVQPEPAASAGEAVGQVGVGGRNIVGLAGEVVGLVCDDSQAEPEPAADPDQSEVRAPASEADAAERPSSDRRRLMPRSQAHRRVKLGEDTCARLAATSLGSARELDALVRIQDTSPVWADALIERALAGKQVSAIDEEIRKEFRPPPPATPMERLDARRSDDAESSESTPQEEEAAPARPQAAATPQPNAAQVGRADPGPTEHPELELATGLEQLARQRSEALAKAGWADETLRAVIEELKQKKKYDQVGVLEAILKSKHCAALLRGELKWGRRKVVDQLSQERLGSYGESTVERVLKFLSSRRWPTENQ
jgi:hypothetical protein